MYINDPNIYIDLIYIIKDKSLNGEKLSFKELYFVNMVQFLIDEQLAKGGYTRAAFEKIVAEIAEEQ